MRGRLEPLTQNQLGRREGKRKIKPRKMNLWKFAARAREMRRE
jgi:hypothetical protein